jgi:transposase
MIPSAASGDPATAQTLPNEANVQAAEKTGVARQTLHRWLARYEAQGLDGLADRSHRPVRCPRQMTAPQDRD